MHASSYTNMAQFVERFLRGNSIGTILDVGSWDDNGSYRKLFRGWVYTGIDIHPGNGVDVVVKDRYNWAEIPSDSFDVVISGQTLEHIEFFWLTMCEINRVLKPGGLCCIVAPSAGPVHSAAGDKDCWRFTPEGLEAAAKWAKLNILTAYIGWENIRSAEDDQWKDCVLVCQKAVTK